MHVRGAGLLLLSGVCELLLPQFVSAFFFGVFFFLQGTTISCLDFFSVFFSNIYRQPRSLLE
jgi:hypothetical protein